MTDPLDSGTRVNASRIAVMMPTWVGDACMATPTLRAVREAFPAAEITMISRPIIRELIDGSWGKNTPWVDDFLLVNKQGSNQSHTRFSLTKVCRQRKFELALLLTNSFWSAAVMRLAGVPRIVGYDRDARGWLLSDRIRVPMHAGKRTPVSAVDYYLALAEYAGCSAANRSMEISVSADDDQRADHLWQVCGFSKNRSTLVINSNAATDPSRIWPESRVCALAKRVAEELGLQVLLHCGPKERDMANRIAKELDHPLVSSMGGLDELPIGLSKAVLQRAALVVSTDSGPRHIAIATNRPVVTLFGPTDPAWTVTYNRPELKLKGTDGRAGISEIAVEDVFAAILTSLGKDSGDQLAVAAA